MCHLVWDSQEPSAEDATPEPSRTGDTQAPVLFWVCRSQALPIGGHSCSLGDAEPGLQGLTRMAAKPCAGKGKADWE